MKTRTKTKKTMKAPKRTLPNEFRFGHRGVEDYPALIQHYKRVFGLPQPLIVRLTGLSPRSVAKWVEGEPPSLKQERALVEMDRLINGLGAVLEPEEVGRWLNQPNAAFDGSTPLQVVERGEVSRLWHMLYEIESGQPG